MCSSCFSSQNSTVQSEEQIFLRQQPAKPFQNHILSFGGTRKCSAHKGNYRKLSLINTKKIPDKVMSEDLGHLPFLLLSIHYFCSGQIFSKALTAQLKAELLCTAYCSLSLTLPASLGNFSAKTCGHLIAKTFTPSLPHTYFHTKPNNEREKQQRK